MKKYVFRAYDPAFPDLFEKEKERIKKILDEGDLIEHIGSTSVPGLGGKGIIDICVATKKIFLKTLSKKLQAIGYEFGPLGGSKERLFHQRSRKYHVHVVFTESWEWNNVIKFRDYLRSHPEEMKRYAKIKKLAAEKANENREVYMRIKSPFIEEMVKKALLI